MYHFDFQEPVLQLKGRNSLYIENYRKLQIYTDQLIRLTTKSGELQVFGTQLVIKYYSKEDLEIHGWIDKISFEK